MKRLVYKIFALLLLVGIHLPYIYGQESTHQFTELNGTHCGQVTVEIRCVDCNPNAGKFNFDNRKQFEGEGRVEVLIKEFVIRQNCKKMLSDKFISSYELKIGTTCRNNRSTEELLFKEIAGENLLYYDKEGKRWSSPIVIKFKAEHNGRGTLMVPYQLKPREGENERTNDCDFFIELPYDISGLLNHDMEDWNQYDQRGVNGWCDYIAKYPNGSSVPKAKIKISDAEQTAWNNVRNSTLVSDFENYVDRFQGCGELCSNCKKAKERITALKTQPKKVDDGSKKDREAFEQAKGRRDSTLYLAYIRDFPNGAFVQEAKDSIIRLKPITRSRLSEPDAEGWMKIQFYNLTDPVFDVPVEGSLIIRDELFKSDGILFIKYGREGKPSLTIGDAMCPWKELRIEDLDNMLVAKIASWDSSAIELKIQLNKGVPPYRIEITDENGDLVFSKKDIRDTVIDIGQADLAAAKITGEYTLTVWDNSDEQAITAGTFRMKAQKKSFWMVVIIGGGLLLASIILVFLLIRRKSRKQRDMFDID